jgi:hypothetical protein
MQVHCRVKGGASFISAQSRTITAGTSSPPPRSHTCKCMCCHAMGRVLRSHVPSGMETLHKHEDPRRDRHAGSGPSGVRLRSGSCAPQTTAAQRQRIQLWLWRVGRMVAGQRHEALTRCAVSSANPRQDPSHGLQANHCRAVERSHQTLKNRILLENYFLPGDLEAQIEAFVDHYNHQRYHESLNNVTPADVYFGPDKAILQQRERIKRKTLETRRLHHRKRAA